MIPDPNTCIYRAHGFELYSRDGVPRVVRTWRKKFKDDAGVAQSEPQRETLTLNGEDWPLTATAQAVRVDMLAAWREFVSWDLDNKTVRDGHRREIEDWKPSKWGR